MTNQQKCVAMAKSGASVKEIAEAVSVSERTVRRYLKISETPPPSVAMNNKVDEGLLFLFQCGGSTRYKCLGVISKYHNLDLFKPEQKEEAERILKNSIKRFQRQKQEFHITPEFIFAADNSVKMLQHFFDEADSLWWHLEQTLDSIIETNYSNVADKNRLRKNLRSELARTLSLPDHTRTNMEKAARRSEVFWRVADICESTKRGLLFSMMDGEPVEMIEEDDTE